MAKLNFSFAGESIQASKLESKSRKFELEFESTPFLSLSQSPTFSVEYFFSINSYAENLSEAFHMAAKEAGIKVEQFNVEIIGHIDSGATKNTNALNSTFNKIEVNLFILSNASDAMLQELLKITNELNPIEESIANQIDFKFSLNAVIHLN